MKIKRKFHNPQHYWKIAESYISKQSEALKGSEYYLDEKLAMKCIKFSSLLKHTSGEFAGVNFQFQDWQIKAIVDIFATKYKEGKYQGLRRYQRVLFFMPKKNGKSEFAGVLHAIMFFIDQDKAKEQYSIATEAEQAKIIHKVFLTMLKQEPELFELVHSTVKPPRITKEDGAFFDEFQSLTSSADTKDGLRPSFLTVDEGHAHTSKDLYQIMTDGLAGRNEPLEVHLSTAGKSKQGFFYLDIYQYAKKIQQGIIKDDRFYSVLFEPDEKDLEDPDYWKNPEIWKKCNPNLGNSPTYSYMEGKITQAEHSAVSLISFITKHLNVWADKADVWIDSKLWEDSFKYKIDEKKLKGKACFGGLDLASVTDIAAFILVFPKDNDEYDVLCRFFIPEDNMKQRSKKDKVPYEQWVKEGLITATKGNIIDYGFIEKQIKKDCEYFDVKEIAYDKWNSVQLVTNLDDAGVSNMVAISQGYGINTGLKEIETATIGKRLNHGNNKVLTWMISNVAIFQNADDKLKIDKNNVIEKIDGVVSLAMALVIKMVSKTVETATPSIRSF